MTTKKRGRGRPPIERAFRWDAAGFRAALARKDLRFTTFHGLLAETVDTYCLKTASNVFSHGDGPHTMDEVRAIARVLGCRIKDLVSRR